MRPLSARSAACPRCARDWDENLSRCGWCGALAGPERCDTHSRSVASWACAVCGRRVCADCRRGGRHAALCAAHEEIPLVQGWAEVARAQDEVRGEMLAGTVRAAGLDVQLLSQKDYAHVFGLSGLAIVRVLVPAYQWPEAREVVNEGGGSPTPQP